MQEVELNVVSRETPSQSRDHVSGETLLHIEQLAMFGWSTARDLRGYSGGHFLCGCTLQPCLCHVQHIT